MSGPNLTIARSTALLHQVSIFFIACLALGLTVATGLALFEVLPWLNMTLTFGEYAFPTGGMWVQILCTAFALTLLFYLPSHIRVMQLERSHRNFRISIADIEAAYKVCHKADQDRFFSLLREYDSVRERFAFLSEHPDLESLEPELLEVAAQMSYESRTLAQAWSEERIGQARDMLRQRDRELRRFQRQIDTARDATEVLRDLSKKLETEEEAAQTALTEIQTDLKDVLDQLGFELRNKPRKVVPMSKAQAVVKAGAGNPTH